MEFAAVFSALRRESGISQRQCAKELGISQALLSHYENGLREPRLDFLPVLCDYFHVSADYLLGRTTRRSAPPDSASPAALAAAECLCLHRMALELEPDDPRRELVSAAALLAQRSYRAMHPAAGDAAAGALLLAQQSQQVCRMAENRIARLESEDQQL